MLDLTLSGMSDVNEVALLAGILMDFSIEFNIRYRKDCVEGYVWFIDLDNNSAWLDAENLVKAFLQIQKSAENCEIDYVSVNLIWVDTIVETESFYFSEDNSVVDEFVKSLKRHNYL